MTDNERSIDIEKRIEKVKSEARARVIKRGIVHFRCDEEMMEQLLQVSNYRKIPVGVLVRSWVAEHLREEFPKVPPASPSKTTKRR